MGAILEHTGDCDSLISQVDKALYWAKAEGRDRVETIQLSSSQPSLKAR